MKQRNVHFASTGTFFISHPQALSFAIRFLQLNIKPSSSSMWIKRRKVQCSLFVLFKVMSRLPITFVLSIQQMSFLVYEGRSYPPFSVNRFRLRRFVFFCFYIFESKSSEEEEEEKEKIKREKEKESDQQKNNSFILDVCYDQPRCM